MIIKYNLENMEKCICCICKVQRSKECPQKMTKYVQGLESEGVDTLTMLKPEEFPWLYCKIGKTICGDLDYKEECLCKECPVWMENSLNDNFPNEFYCKYGQSKK